MQILLDIPDTKIPIERAMDTITLFFKNGHVYKCNYPFKELPKGHGRLKDEDEIIRAIEDRVEFLRKNDAIFMRLRKDIDILGCIPKIRCEVPTIIEADKEE